VGVAHTTALRWQNRFAICLPPLPTAVDLFCGAGGLSLGIKQHLAVAQGYDWHSPAVDVYNRNLAHGADVLDLADVTTAVRAIRRLAPAVIVGSPPCQDFSAAGCQTESDRASLTVAFAEIVTGVMPRAFLMENVDRAQSSSAWQVAREILKAAGYGITERVICASLLGVPQRRRRLIVWGILDGMDDALGHLADSRLASRPLSVAEALPHLPAAWYRHPRNPRTCGIYTATEPSPTITATNRPIPSGYLRRSGDAADPATVRHLTPAERAEIQGFPPTWEWTGSQTARDLLVGNAVPPPVGAWAASILIDGLAQR